MQTRDLFWLCNQGLQSPKFKTEVSVALEKKGTGSNFFKKVLLYDNEIETVLRVCCM